MLLYLTDTDEHRPGVGSALYLLTGLREHGGVSPESNLTVVSMSFQLLKSAMLSCRCLSQYPQGDF